MTGPPGAGKTLLTRAMPGILPAMTPQEALEVTKIYSVAGLLPQDMPMMQKRPFRAPHHTVSHAGLVGRGRTPRPGERTPSHRGALFRDQVPHVPGVLGGTWEENGWAYGLPIAAIPYRRIPEALDIITDFYLRMRQKGDRFMDFVQRVGKAQIRQALDGLIQNKTTHDEDPSVYTDWADPPEYTTGDLCIGECAREMGSALACARPRRAVARSCTSVSSWSM